MKNRRIVVLGAAVVLAHAGCHSSGVHDRNDEHAHEAAAAEGGGSGTPVVSLEGFRGIQWITAPEPRAEGAWYPGEAIGDETAQRVLSSPVEGRVASAPVPPGRSVARGAALLAIDSPEQADVVGRLLKAKADAERAESVLAQEERLFAAGAASQRDLDDARREAGVCRAELESARLGMDSRGLTEADRSARFVLRAPAEGAVVRWSVRVGQGIEAGEELGAFQTASAKLVRLDLSLPGPGWKLGDATEARASDGTRWKARVVGVPAVLAEDTRRLTFRLELSGSALPLPGQPLEVRVPFATAVILPQSAVQQIEGVWGVFARADDRAEFHPVRRGIELGSDVVIEDGVRPGELVAADGAYLLKSAWLKARSGGDEHEH